MLTLTLFYLPIALSILIVLAVMILRIGTLIGGCPVTRRTAEAASVTIATGFAAIGGGGVALIGVLVIMFQDLPVMAVLMALGFAGLCLGLGFAHAVGTLRALVLAAAKP